MNTETLLKRAKELEDRAKAAASEWCRLQGDVHKKEPSMYGDFHGGYKLGALSERQRIRDMLEKMREALEWYSNKENWDDEGVAWTGEIGGDVFVDGGSRARQALSDADALAAKVGEI